MPLTIDQSTINFVRSQATHVEAAVYRTQYAEIQYPDLIPVDTSANPWTKTITFQSMDSVGMAEWISGYSKDVPLVNFSQSQFESGVHMAAIGYGWNLEEINQAQMLNVNLSNEKGLAARRSYEEFIDSYLLRGSRPDNGSAKDTDFHGLIDYPGVTVVVAPNGASSSPDWASKTADEVLLDINNILSGVWIDSQNIELADTLLLSENAYVQLANKRIPNTDTTLMRYVMENNILRMRFGRDLTIRTVRGLETAGNGGVERVVCYRRNPEVLKAHIPMPLRFLPVQQKMLEFVVPGIFRFGGLDIRRMGAVRYLDGI